MAKDVHRLWIRFVAVGILLIFGGFAAYDRSIGDYSLGLFGSLMTAAGYVLLMLGLFFSAIGPGQVIIAAAELDRYLADGWRLVTTLPDGRVVVER